MKHHRLSHVQVIALGYLIMILIGTGILMLPFASADGQTAPFREALFTATSASCVTGLVLRDTVTSWSMFGQSVIILLIQIGGLGFMTIATFAFLVMQKRMGLRNREIMLESINNSNINGIMQLTGEIVKGTLLFEGVGALLMTFVFVPRLGFWKGLWYSVFHAISAFCNAGFDLMGYVEPYNSFVSLADNVLLNITLMLLIVIGGLGFLVWHDIRVNRFRFKRYSLHTKIVLITSGVLVFGSALLFLIFEWNATGKDLPLGAKILTALFASVTTRTAGFNTVDIPAMANASKLLTIMLMVIGGSPGSTAGGVKTTSLAVIVLYTLAGFRGQRKPAVFGRSISSDLFRKSCVILFFNAGLALFAGVLIAGMQPFDLVDVLFETFSAVGTVGMTAGITRDLNVLASYVIALLMFIGRVGSVSFAVALLEKKAKPPVLYPEEEITIG